MSAKPVAPAAPATIKAPATAGDLLKRTKREPAYRIAKDGTRGMTGEQSFVTRGVHVKSGDSALVHVNGESQTALPLAVVAQAIVDNVITDQEIAYLQSLRP